MKSLYDAVKPIVSLVALSRTASENGVAVDTLGYNDAMVVIQAGDIDLTTGNETYTFSVEESADGSTSWAAISGATNTVTADNQTKTIRVGGLGVGTRKRYLRAVLTAAGTTPIIPCSAVVLLGNAFRKPVANS